VYPAPATLVAPVMHLIHEFFGLRAAQTARQHNL
jgi:hypothetical protein